MKKTRVFINGFGRIGRAAARIILEDQSLELVGINDIYDFKQMAELLQNDSIYGRCQQKITLHHDTLYIKEQPIKLFNISDPKALDLSALDIDVMLQCSGIFLSTEQNRPYLDSGAKKVIISAPASDHTPTYIYGVNHQHYKNESIISNSSCSANAIVPIFAIIEKHFGIKSAMLSMYHSYTAYQKLLDVKHYSKDIRRARAATQNIIPLESSAANATSKFFSHLDNKLYAKSIRVPIIATTFYDLSIQMRTKSEESSVIAILKNEITHNKKDILDIFTEERVSSDFIQTPYSASIDINTTTLIGGNLLGVHAWQDNEYGYAQRLVDMLKVITT